MAPGATEDIDSEALVEQLEDQTCLFEHKYEVLAKTLAKDSAQTEVARDGTEESGRLPSKRWDE